MMSLNALDKNPAAMVVLNFHGVGPLTRDVDSGEFDCWLEVDFLNRVLDLTIGRTDVLLTADDGNLSDVEILLPALKQRGLSATFFLVTCRIGQPTFVGLSEIQLLLQEGMLIGSHGMQHRSWLGLPDLALHEEVCEARSKLEMLTGQPIFDASCPFGGYDRRSLARLKHAGYRAVYTSDGGWSKSSDWLVSRITVRRSMSLDDVSNSLRGSPGRLRALLRTVKTMVKRIR